MIIVTLDLKSARGVAENARIGEVSIINDGTGSSDCGNYSVKLAKSAKFGRPGIWRTGHVSRFQRLVHGPYDLLFLALESALGPKRIKELHDFRDGTAPRREPGEPHRDAENCICWDCMRLRAGRPVTDDDIPF